jgi:hypothetical protein
LLEDLCQALAFVVGCGHRLSFPVSKILDGEIMSVKIMSRVWEKSTNGGSQLLLLLAIADNANDGGVAWPGQIYLANKIKMSKRSIPRIASKLKTNGDLYINDRGDEGRVTQYIVTLGMSEQEFEVALKTHLKWDAKQISIAMEWFKSRRGRQIVTPDIAMSRGDDIAMSRGDDIAMSTEPSTTIDEPSFKQPSAKADYSRPISLLSEKEIKALKLPFPTWKQYLVDERAERERKGVIKFVEGKIKYGQLRPVNEDELKLFEILAIEYEADGGKSPPNKFPSLETKRLFNEAANFHNGTLEAVIKKAIHKRGKGIAKIVDYINSPEWRRKGQHERTRTPSSGKGQQGINGNTTDSFQPGNGRTPEMQAKLEAAFAPKPG